VQDKAIPRDRRSRLFVNRPKLSEGTLFVGFFVQRLAS
jgi:hypothetical protein